MRQWTRVLRTFRVVEASLCFTGSFSFAAVTPLFFVIILLKMLSSHHERFEVWKNNNNNTVRFHHLGQDTSSRPKITEKLRDTSPTIMSCRTIAYATTFDSQKRCHLSVKAGFFPFLNHLPNFPPKLQQSKNKMATQLRT